MRLFIAVDVSERVREALKPALSALSRYKGVKAVEPENVHVTLQFLGEVPESRVGVISDRLERVAKNFEPFNVRLGKLGFFPNQQKLRVVWVGVEGVECEGLKPLADAVRGEMKKLGYRDDKDFVAHMTLARVKKITPQEKRRLLEELESLEFEGEWTVKDFRLKQSRLTPKGPIYSDVSVHAFASG